jgi:hypothetical protein
MVCFETALIFSSRLSLVICRKEPGANRPKVYFLWVEWLNAFGPMKQLRRLASSTCHARLGDFPFNCNVKLLSSRLVQP